MGFFNFVETFFFVSLAITFVLIMMLVYHFKERLSALEKKSNTIVEIMNNMVKEITMTKQQLVHHPQLLPSSFLQQSSHPVLEHDENEEDSSVSEESDESESESESESDYESEGDSTTYDDLVEEIQQHVNVTHLEEELESVHEEQPENIKRININLSVPSNTVLDGLEDIQEIEHDDAVLEDTIDIDIAEINETEAPIVINKIDGPMMPDLEEVKPVEHHDGEVYRKMEIGALRALVISKGLASDTKKMKKTELIRLLESAHE